MSNCNPAAMNSRQRLSGKRKSVIQQSCDRACDEPDEGAVPHYSLPEHTQQKCYEERTFASEKINCRASMMLLKFVAA